MRWFGEKAIKKVGQPFLPQTEQRGRLATMAQQAERRCAAQQAELAAVLAGREALEAEQQQQLVVCCAGVGEEKGAPPTGGPAKEFL